MVSKALVVGAYQRKAEELARLPDVELTLAVPPYWREGRHRQTLERAHIAGYSLVVLPMALNGHYHVHFYRRLAALIDVVAPDVLHMDEEPYNLATFQGLRLAVTRRIPALFYTWRNIDHRYPPPFSLIERYNVRHAAYGIAGNEDAAAITRARGYRGPLAIIPQFGVDPDIFHPREPRDGHDNGRFVIGFVGRLIPAKGLRVLLEALAGAPGDWELRVVGTGEERQPAEALAMRLGLAERVVFLGQQPSTAMPDVVREFDLLVGPSLTAPTWKEQFGRMLVEAMSCGVPVIGSDSGEIPNVIGEAGVVVPEGNVPLLRDAIVRLRGDPTERQRLATLGRARVLDLYTQAAIARRYHEVYARMQRGDV